MRDQQKHFWLIEKCVTVLSHCHAINVSIWKIIIDPITMDMVEYKFWLSINYDFITYIINKNVENNYNCSCSWTALPFAIQKWIKNETKTHYELRFGDIVLYNRKLLSIILFDRRALKSIIWEGIWWMKCWD